MWFHAWSEPGETLAVGTAAYIWPVRSSGHGNLKAVAAVLLETDGSRSVVPDHNVGEATALADLSGWAPESSWRG
ncbi:MAG: hypothetical protein ABI586_04690 [Candidatus Nanopelagicales bacterium]